MLIIFVPSVALSISLWLEVDLIFRTSIRIFAVLKREISNPST